MTQPYCWDPSKIHPLESFWSMVHKFAFWNCCTAREILLHFGKKGHSGLWKSLLPSCPFDLPKTLKILELTGDRLEKSFLNFYMKNEEIKFYTLRDLRFCPKCLAEGYHSPVHQVLLITACPYHGESLLKWCPKCRNPIRPIVSPVDLIPYTCPTCGYSLFPHLQDHQFSGKSPDRDQVFQKIGGLLRSHRNLEGISIYPRAWAGLHMHPKTRAQNLAVLLQIWRQMTCGEDPPDGHGLSLQNGRFFRFTKQQNRDEQDSDLLGIYKAVRRYLLRILKPHRRCIDLLIRRCWWLWKGIRIEGITLCPPAIAFVLWKNHWEDRERFNRVQGGGTPNLSTFSLDSEIWEHPYFGGKGKAFGLTCLGIFKEALLWGEKMERQGFFEVPKQRFEGSLYPYWESFVSPEGKNVFCYWLKPSDLLPRSPERGHFSLVFRDINRAEHLFCNQVLRPVIEKIGRFGE